MIARATGTATVLRGTTTDDYGDPVDGTTPVLSGIPWSVLEQRRTVTTPDDPDPRWVVMYTGRMPAGTALVRGDRIRDDASGQVYILDSFSETTNPYLRADIRLDLRRVS